MLNEPGHTQPASEHRTIDHPVVLLVEDEPGIAETVTFALRKEGLTVARRATARETREFLARERADLIVLDIGLPDGNGFDLCKEIRAGSAVPILFLTARAEEVDRIVGLEIGADDYVAKPFSPRELAARVKAILRRSGPRSVETPPPAGNTTPFAVDEPRARIVYFDRPLELSRCEFRLLQALVRRPGWVFSRAQLLDLAWDEPDASLERTVDTHIKTLRAKLRAVRPDVDPIRTHRGLGYSLRESW